MSKILHARHSPFVISAVLFVAAAALYARTAAPTLGGGFDSEEFQHAAYTLGIAHATGYPFYLLLGKLFTTLVPAGDIARRMNLLSALISAGTVVLVYLNCRQLTKRTIASLGTAVLFATNPAVWRQAGVASVGPLHLLLLAAILYALVRWYATEQAGARTAPVVPAFLFGLGLTHHSSTLALAPAIAVLILLVDRDILRRPRNILTCTFWLLVPLLLYLYLPLFGSASPWYTNTPEGFLTEISGGDAGVFERASPDAILEGVALTSQYLFDSLGYLGGALILVGALSRFPNLRTVPAETLGRVEANDKRTGSNGSTPLWLFLGLATLSFSLWGTLYAGEPDRYLVLTFVFLIYWVATGAAVIEDKLTGPRQRPWLRPAAQAAFAVLLASWIALPFVSRFRMADWSTFDRVYKQWDEIFTLPIPQGAILVGNWPQLNAMRYMQRIENRRPDLELVGTLYDPTPQTEAAQTAFAEGRALYLSPGLALPVGSYRYALLGPLLEVREEPRMQPPALAVSATGTAVAPSLSLAGWDLSTALEPYPSQPRLAAGRTERVTLYWQAEGPLDDLIIRLRLTNPDGRLVAQTDEPPVRGLYLSSRWQPGEFVADVHNFLIPAGTPPGQYSLHVQVMDTTRSPAGREIALAKVDITRATNATRDQVFVQHSLSLSPDPRLAIVGYGGTDGVLKRGYRLGLYLVWNVLNPIDEDLELDLTLADRSGQILAGWRGAPIAFYPTHEWQGGELLKAYYDLDLPDLPPGTVTLQAGLNQQTPVPIAQVQIMP